MNGENDFYGFDLEIGAQAYKTESSQISLFDHFVLYDFFYDPAHMPRGTKESCINYYVHHSINLGDIPSYSNIHVGNNVTVTGYLKTDVKGVTFYVLEDAPEALKTILKFGNTPPSQDSS